MTWLGLTEATCNLWALYILETVALVPWELTHDGYEFSAETREERILAYIAGGRNFKEDLQSGFNAYQGFLPLEPFLQLQEAFGWELFHTLAKEYRGLSDAETPVTEEARLQEWLLRISKTAGVNLVPFYLDWGFPIDPAIQSELSLLPAWDLNPMDPYD